MHDSVGSYFDNCFVLEFEVRGEEATKAGRMVWEVGLGRFTTDLVRLMLLVIIEDCMMDVVGHSNLHMW